MLPTEMVIDLLFNHLFSQALLAFPSKQVFGVSCDSTTAQNRLILLFFSVCGEYKKVITAKSRAVDWVSVLESWVKGGPKWVL